VAGHLDKLGVTVLPGVKVDTVDEQGVIAGWKQDPEAHGALTGGSWHRRFRRCSGSKTDRAGRALVDPFLKVGDAPGVFVVATRHRSCKTNIPVPGVAQAGSRKGRYVGRLIAKELKGRKVKRPFRYFARATWRRGQELRGAAAGLATHSGFLTWLVVGVRSRPLPASAAETAARACAVALVIFPGQRSSGLIPEAAMNANRTELTMSDHVRHGVEMRS